LIPFGRPSFFRDCHSFVGHRFLLDFVTITILAYRPIFGTPIARTVLRLSIARKAEHRDAGFEKAHTSDA
jgi:hypothetical protein